MRKNYKAIAIGLAVVVVADVLCLGRLYSDSGSNIGFLLWSSLLVAGFATSLTASSHQIQLSLVLALPIALLQAISNLVWQLLGKPSDFPGVYGFLMVMGMTIPLALVLSGAGGLFGWLLKRQRASS